MSKSTNQNQSGWGSAFPGQEACALDAEDDREWGLVSLYASVPILGNLTGSFLRFNLYSDVSGTRDLVASAIAPPGTVGELIAVSGHTADSWHVTVQATRPTQQAKISLVARPCCAPPLVRVRADMLSLAFAGSEVGLGALQTMPMVPWGVEFGASNTYAVSGSGTLVLPKGARLTHWLAEGAAGPPSTLEFDGLAAGTPFGVGAGLPVREGFPAAEYVSQIVYVNLGFGLFDIVV